MMSGPVARSKRSTPCSATTMPPQDCATDRGSPVSQDRACCSTQVSEVSPSNPRCSCPPRDAKDAVDTTTTPSVTWRAGDLVNEIDMS